MSTAIDSLSSASTTTRTVTATATATATIQPLCSTASPSPSPTPTPTPTRPLLNLSKPINNSNLDNGEEDTSPSAPHQLPPPSASSSASPHLHLGNHLNQPHNSGFTIRKQQPRTGMAPAPYADSSHSKPAPAPSASSSSSSSAPPGASPPSSVFPALHLIPLNETFVPKQISLVPPGARVKIGRQTNAKTIPNGSNGYFDSKVLSRMHAEVWSEDGKVLIKDVKSSNGTFIDGQRLSAEAAESDVFELRTGSTVEFGIDIVSDDSKTIVHHKVAAKVHVVMNPDDALASSREFNAWFRNAGDQPSQRRGARPLGGGQQQNGLSFEHVLNRLQGELQKSRDTGSNLGDLSSTLNEVQDTLGGAAPPANFAASQRGMPPYLPNGHSPSNDHHAQSIAALQSQLNETQTSLAGHVGKIRDLEGLLAEHDVIKREVGSLRKQMEEAKRDMERMMRTRGSDESAPGGTRSSGGADGRESPIAKLLEQQEDDEAETAADDDDDARSISSVDTISPSSNSKVNGILSAVAGAAAGAASSKLTSTASSHDDDDLARSNAAAATVAAAAKEADLARERQLQEQNAKLSARLETLSAELDEATKLGQSLRSQHAEASSTIRALEERVLGLEKAVEGRVKEVEGKVLKECEGKWQGWRDKFEEGWRKERAGWEEEREKLMAVVREWEERRRDSSGSEDEGEMDEEDGTQRSRNIGSTSSTGSSATLVDSSDTPSSTAAFSSSPNSTTTKSKPRSRRRRRSTAIAPGSGSRISKLAEGTSSAVHSDSDSTIGSGEGVGRSVGDWGSAPKGSAGVNGFDETNHGQGSGSSQSATTYASAGVVVAVGVVVAYALSLKMKE